MRLRGIVGTGLGFAAAGLTWGFIEARLFKLRRVEVSALPPDARPVRVLHISDIHLLGRHGAKRAWLAGLVNLRPDLVINTGDNISSADAIGPLVETLGRLLDVPGVFVFGSNDYASPSFRNPLSYLWGAKTTPTDDDLPWRELADAFTSRAWTNLTEQRATLTVAGLRFDFRGTDDAHHDRDDYSAVAGPVDPEADLSVGVTHAPYRCVLDAMTADGVDMIFAGHTHGGQVCVPGMGAIITNCDLPRAQAKGLSIHTTGSHVSWLHVSAGVGASPFAPYRFACRPEATLLTLVSREK